MKLAFYILSCIFLLQITLRSEIVILCGHQKYTYEEGPRNIREVFSVINDDAKVTRIIEILSRAHPLGDDEFVNMRQSIIDLFIVQSSDWQILQIFSVGERDIDGSDADSSFYIPTSANIGRLLINTDRIDRISVLKEVVKHLPPTESISIPKNLYQDGSGWELIISTNMAYMSKLKEGIEQLIDEFEE